MTLSPQFLSLQHQILSLSLPLPLSLSLMADHTRSHTTTDLYKILGIPIKDICKGFKKWNPSEKSPRNKTIEGGGGGDRNFISIKEPDKVRKHRCKISAYKSNFRYFLPLIHLNSRTYYAISSRLGMNFELEIKSRSIKNREEEKCIQTIGLTCQSLR